MKLSASKLVLASTVLLSIVEMLPRWRRTMDLALAQAHRHKAVRRHADFG